MHPITSFFRSGSSPPIPVCVISDKSSWDSWSAIKRITRRNSDNATSCSKAVRIRAAHSISGNRSLAHDVKWSLSPSFLNGGSSVLPLLSCPAIGVRFLPLRDFRVFFFRLLNDYSPERLASAAEGPLNGLVLPITASHLPFQTR